MILEPHDLHRLLSVVCGVWFLPHTISKLFAAQERKAQIVGFFAAAGLRPPAVLVLASAGIELIVALGMALNIYAGYAALLGGTYLTVATVAVLRVFKYKWIWFERGAEYTLFWAIICFVLGVSAP